MAANGCYCPIDKECFGKRGYGNKCVVLTDCATHRYTNDKNEVYLDCAFRKEFQSKPKGWEPKTDYDREWAKAEKEKILKKL